MGCVPEYKEQYEFSQVMTKVILDEEFDDYEVFGQEERRELIFRLFMHLVYGGPLNQYEDSVGPYFDLTKGLYKDLVSCVIAASTLRYSLIFLPPRVASLRAPACGSCVFLGSAHRDGAAGAG